MLPLRLLTGVFNHSGRSESTILVVTQASVSQPYAHVRREISYLSPRKFRLDMLPDLAVLRDLAGITRSASGYEATGRWPFSRLRDVTGLSPWLPCVPSCRASSSSLTSASSRSEVACHCIWCAVNWSAASRIWLIAAPTWSEADFCC